MAKEDVLVIGAGPAGINAAYHLEKLGISYKVIDRASVIASTWHSLYPSLMLNTSRFFSHMPGKRFPLSWGIYPSGREYYQHVEEFIAENDFNIHLGIEVISVSPKGDMWRVETDQGVDYYPAVISATGVFGNPIFPEISGMKDFDGLLMHAHDFKDPNQVRDMRVMVVGNGPSGIDIATAVGKVSKGPAKIAIRTGVDLRPNYPYGLPPHVWMMIAGFLPDALCQWLMTKVSSKRYTGYEQFGLKSPPPGTKTLTAYRGSELIDAVRAGTVAPVEAPRQFYEQSVQLFDGSVHELDAVIMATGYIPVLHQYLNIEMQYNDNSEPQYGACEWDIGPNGVRGWPLRDVSQHPNGRQILGHPGLYLVGVFYKGKGAMYNMDKEAEIAANQIEKYLAAHPSSNCHDDAQV